MSEKHLVCQGAICKCQFGTVPDKLMVKTQSKRYINDKDGSQKLMATHVDIGTTFEKNTFGSCAKMNNSPCTPAVTKWDGYYENITVEDNSGKALLEDSKATCAVSGAPSIEITFHGQTAEPNQQNADNVRQEVVAQLLPVEDNEKCFCEREFTEEDIREIIKNLRETEKIKTTLLFYDENCPLPDTDKTYKRLCEELNNMMKKHNINSCIRKIHFLAQSYHESSRYATTLEYSSGKKYNPGNHSDANNMEHTIEGDGPRYKGRGIIQLTWRKTQKKYFSYVLDNNPELLYNKKLEELFDRKPLYKEKYIYYKDKTDAKGNKILNKKGKPIKEKIIEMVDVDSASLIASNLHFAFDSAGWYWENIGKTVPTGENINLVADKDDVFKVSQCINGKVKKPYGLEERKKFTNCLKILFKYEELCISKK